MTQTLLVNQTDFSDVAIVNIDDAPLEAGHIRVAIGPFALTANNVTYMVTGHQIGYWHYFDPKADGIEMDGPDGTSMGRMPVWGYAVVTESRCEGIEAGRKIYGFWPVADSFDLKPVGVNRTGFMDGRDHRISLHGIYNRYSFVDADPSYAQHSDLQPVLRPLFTTSFLIDDFLDDEGFFGADQVLILSASSKTALGTAFCLKRRGGVKVTGLTSAGNTEFVKGTGFYDTVASYDDLALLDKKVKTVIVDMSGNADVIADLQDHFTDSLLYICRVGLSHWTARTGKTGSAQKTRSEFFFAPDRASLRIKDWGGAKFAQKLGVNWGSFLDAAKDWLSIEHHQGMEAILPIYKDILQGSARPDKGYLFKI